MLLSDTSRFLPINLPIRMADLPINHCQSRACVERRCKRHSRLLSSAILQVFMANTTRPFRNDGEKKNEEGVKNAQDEGQTVDRLQVGWAGENNAPIGIKLRGSDK